jgi:plastocyanin
MPSMNTVLVRDNFFDPTQLTVTVGRPVVWRNQGSISHSATSGTPVSNPGALFDSQLIAPGGGFTFTFSQPGTYIYFCKVHGASMSGSIVVQ